MISKLALILLIFPASYFEVVKISKLVNLIKSISSKANLIISTRALIQTRGFVKGRFPVTTLHALKTVAQVDCVHSRRAVLDMWSIGSGGRGSHFSL